MAKVTEADTPAVLPNQEARRRDLDARIRTFEGVIDDEDWDDLEYEEEFETFEPIKRKRK